MDLDTRMAEVEARVRALDAITFGETEHGNIPADEYFAAREAGGEVGQAAYEEQATRQRVTEQDWNRLLADQLAKKQAEAGARADVLPAAAEQDYITQLQQHWTLANPELWVSGGRSALITMGGDVYEAPRGQTHDDVAGRVLDVVEPGWQEKYKYPFDEALPHLAKQTGWVRAAIFIRAGDYPRVQLGFDMYTRPTASQVRAFRRLIEAKPGAMTDIFIHFDIADWSDGRGGAAAYDYDGVVRALRERGLLPAMADVAEQPAVATLAPEAAYVAVLAQHWPIIGPETWNPGPHSVLITRDGSLYTSVSGEDHSSIAVHILDVAEPGWRSGPAAPIAAAHMAESAGWIQVTAYKSHDLAWGTMFGFTMYQNPTAAQVRAMKRLIDSQPNIRGITVSYFIHGSRFGSGQGPNMPDWPELVRFLRNHGLLPQTMADAVEELTVAPARNIRPEGAPTTAAEMIAELEAADFVDLSTVETMLGERPDYLDAVATFILEQREKLRTGALTPRDVAKAYIITVGSQRAAAIDPNIITEKSGFVVPERFTTINQYGARVVRPEDAIGAWLLTPEGQRALDSADACQLDFASWNLLAWMRQAWGIDQYLRLNVFGGRGPLRTGSPARDASWYNMTNICALTDALNECHGDSACLDGVIGRVSGVGAGKLGFMKHLIGLGDTPTVDAIETNFWLTGQADVRHLNDEDGRLIRSTAYWEHDRTVRQYLLGRFRELFASMRAAGIGADLDPDVYAHIVHHWLWDKAKGARTEHVGMYEGQMFGATLPLTLPPTFEETVALMREKRAEQATMQDQTPNLRDFYPDRDAYERAIEQHGQKYAQLQADLEQLGAHRNQLRQSRGATLPKTPEMTGLLTDALASEHQAIEMYDNIVGEAGLTDNETRLVAEAILIDEMEHAGKLDSLLRQPITTEPQEVVQTLQPVAEECAFPEPSATVSPAVLDITPLAPEVYEAALGQDWPQREPGPWMHERHPGRYDVFSAYLGPSGTFYFAPEGQGHHALTLQLMYRLHRESKAQFRADDSILVNFMSLSHFVRVTIFLYAGEYATVGIDVIHPLTAAQFRRLRTLVEEDLGNVRTVALSHLPKGATDEKTWVSDWRSVVRVLREWELLPTTMAAYDDGAIAAYRWPDPEWQVATHATADDWNTAIASTLVKIDTEDIAERLEDNAHLALLVTQDGQAWRGKSVFDIHDMMATALLRHLGDSRDYNRVAYVATLAHLMRLDIEDGGLAMELWEAPTASQLRTTLAIWSLAQIEDRSLTVELHLLDKPAVNTNADRRNDLFSFLRYYGWMPAMADAEPMPAAVMAQCEQEAPVSPSGDVAEWVSGMTGSPGIVVDAEEAGRYPCIRIQLRPGHNLVYQKGIIGPLDAEQQALYCRQGYTEREPTEKQRERMAAMSDAAKLCRVESAGGTTQEHLVRYFSCLGRELRTKGVSL